MENEGRQIAVVAPTAVAEIGNLEVVKVQFKRLQEFIASQMQEGRDYGKIPGCPKFSLWKSGAEKLLNLHGLACRLKSTPETIVDFKAGLFHYCYSAEVFNPRTGAVIAVSEGSCNSKEKKYAVDRNGNPRDPWDQVNVFCKMAQKRAMVGATLMACRASDIFTPDEDEGEEGGAATGAGDAPPAQRQSQQSSGNKISDPQAKRFFAIAKGAGKTEAQIKEYLKEQFDIEHSRDLTQGDLYNTACTWAGNKE
jgi:hypothetical protein